MDDSEKLPRTSPTSGFSSDILKVIGFWAVFWLVLTGLRHVELPGFGKAGASIAAVAAMIVLLAAIAALMRSDGGSFREIGLNGLGGKTPTQFLLGVGLGVAVVAAMMLVMLLLTPLEIEASVNSNIPAVLALSFVVLILLALMEEIAFRSYALFTLKQALGTRPAIYITAIAFGLYHGIAYESLLGPGVWGLFFGYMAVSTNSIALPTGFHLGLNWLQALLGMKPQYSDSIWELSIGTSSKPLAVETTGLLLQLVLLGIAVVIVERLVRNQASADSADT